jgi:hypothetical protein
MAFKRKTEANGKDRSSKKAKPSTPVSANARSDLVEKAPVEERNPGEAVQRSPTRIADTGADDVTPVDWVMPTKADNKTIDDTDAITQFSLLISGRPWLQTLTLHTPFQSSPLRSPLYKKKGSPDMEADSDNNKSGHCMARLFNRIKKCTESPNDGTSPTTYERTAFERAFGVGEQQSAVIASTSSTKPIINLSRDHYVDV